MSEYPAHWLADYLDRRLSPILESQGFVLLRSDCNESGFAQEYWSSAIWARKPYSVAVRYEFWGQSLTVTLSWPDGSADVGTLLRYLGEVNDLETGDPVDYNDVVPLCERLLKRQVLRFADIKTAGGLTE